jgi:hypothetical protein
MARPAMADEGERRVTTVSPARSGTDLRYPVSDVDPDALDVLPVEDAAVHDHVP